MRSPTLRCASASATSARTFPSVGSKRRMPCALTTGRSSTSGCQSSRRPVSKRTSPPFLPLQLFVSIAVWVDDADGEVVVRFDQFPAAVFFAVQGGLIREELFGDFFIGAGDG